MRKNSLLANRSLFDVLESRQLLAPTISGFNAIPSALVNQLDNVNLSVTVTAPEGVRAVTFFRDINNDGHWSPGVDIDLGASFSPVSTDTYQLTISPDSGWSRNSHIAADAVGINDEWTAAGPATLNLTVNRQPSVTSVSVSSGSVEAGQPVTFRGRASDDAGIHLMTFFLDRNGDGSFDAGSDTPLGDVLTPNGQGEYVLDTTVGLDWANSSQVVADAQDSDLTWSLSPTPVFITVNNDPPPRITASSVATSRNQAGEPQLQVSATVTDAGGTLATTFFLDLDNNGRWTPAADLSLETFFTGGGTNITRTVSFPTDLMGRASVNVYVDAVDPAGHWRGSTLIGAATQPAAAQVTSFYVDQQFTNVFRLTADANSPGQYGNASTSIAEVQFFIDQNGNGVYNAGTDRMLGGQTTFATLGNGERRFVLDVDLTSLPWNGQGVFAAVITTGSGMVYGTPLSGVRQAPVRGTLGGIPVVNSITTEVGINPSNGATTFATPGTAVRVSATWSAALGGRFITFFFDRNNNGLWDPGIDYDLGFSALSGTTGTVNFTSQALPSNVFGFGTIAAAVQDLSVRGADSWGPTRTDSVRQIRVAPSVASVSGPSTAAVGSTLNFTARMTDDYGVRTATAFLDVNGNGLDGADRTTGTFTRISGTVRDGVWQFSMNLTGIAAGTYRIYVAALDFYQGHASQPGGVTTGLWGARTAYQVTIQ